MIDVSALYLARLEFMLYSYLMIQTFIHPVNILNPKRRITCPTRYPELSSRSLVPGEVERQALIAKLHCTVLTSCKELA